MIPKGITYSYSLALGRVPKVSSRCITESKRLRSRPDSFDVGKDAPAAPGIKRSSAGHRSAPECPVRTPVVSRMYVFTRTLAISHVSLVVS